GPHVSAEYCRSELQIANGLTKIIPPAEWPHTMTQFGMTVTIASATQICVLEPEPLRRCFEAASALFAAPGPGDRLRGRLLWQGLGCGNERPRHGEGAHEPGEIHFVRRGRCSFSAKSAVAARHGASAVLVADFESAQDHQAADTLVAGSQGPAGRVPLWLLGAGSAGRLLEALEAGEPVEIEVEVGKPAAAIVMDVWLPPDAGTLLASLAPKARDLAGLRVRVHFRVVAAPEEASPAQIARHCYAGLRELCSARVLQPSETTPAAPWLREAVFQHCLLRGFPERYWWKYVEMANCSSDSCSRSLLAQLGLSARDARAVQHCADSEAASFLEDDRESAPWGSAEEIALRINGWRYSGPLEAPRILRTLCWQLESSAVCQRLLRKDPDTGHGLLLWHLAGCCILAVTAGCTLRGPLMWSARRLLRRLGHACKAA
ncbi:BP80, partial [Symbiodinium microadriaticum]